MTDKLPQHLLSLFSARPPLKYLEYPDKPPQQRLTKRLTGVAQYLAQVGTFDQDYTGTKTDQQLREERLRRKKTEYHDRLEHELAIFKPSDDPQARGNPFKTLFVARLGYNVAEADLQDEFSRYGSIERIRLVKDKTGHSRGYAFIVYRSEDEVKAAYKQSNHKELKGRRILVDVERGRTVRNWKPQRLGGGLGAQGYSRTVAYLTGRARESDRRQGGSDRGYGGGDRGYSGGGSSRYSGGYNDGGYRGGSSGGGDRGGGDRGGGDRGGGDRYRGGSTGGGYNRSAPPSDYGRPRGAGIGYQTSGGGVGGGVGGDSYSAPSHRPDAGGYGGGGYRRDDDRGGRGGGGYDDGRSRREYDDRDSKRRKY